MQAVQAVGKDGSNPSLTIKSQILVLRKLSNKLASSDISVRLFQMQ